MRDLVGRIIIPFSSGETTKHPDKSIMGSRPSHDQKTNELFPVLHAVMDLGTQARPKRDSSQSIIAWPLHHRPLPDCPGCLPLAGSSNDFCTGTNPHRYALVQFPEPHGLRLSVIIQRLTHNTCISSGCGDG